MADKPLAFPWLNPKGPQESMALSTMEPAVAEQCKQQLVKQHMLFKQQTAALASAVYRQVCLANEIPIFVEEDGSRIQVWNPLETVKAELTAAQGAKNPETTVLAAAAAATTSAVSSPEAKTARLVPEQEQVLLRFFGAQDRVDREEALLLAKQANCSEQQVRQYLANLRSNLRSFIQRAQRNAAGKAASGAAAAAGVPAANNRPAAGEGPETAGSTPTQEEGDTDSMAQADRARQKAFGRLDTYLDENGGINDPAKAGAFANFMRLMRQDGGSEQLSFTVWQAQLQAVARTARSLTLSKLAATPDLVPTLGTMLRAAEQDQQISFIRQLLQALRKLPFPWAMVEGSDLLKRVLNLQKHRLPRVAAAAAAIACHWQQLGGLGGVPFALPASSPSSRPSKGTLLPSAHQMGSVGRPTAAPHPVGQGSSASGATKGQDLALSEGQDQRLMHLIDSRGVGRGGSHSDGALTHPGSHEVADRNGSGGLSQQGMRQGSGNGPRGALGPAQAYTRGFVPRKRSNMAPAKPLSADEIVKANAKKRANGAQMGGPVKVGRLDAATMAALGRRGPGSGLGQLLAQSTGPSSGEGGGQPTGQAAAQHAGQISGLSAGRGIGQGQGRNQAQGIGQGSGQVHGQALAGSSHVMSSHGPGSSPAPIPGPGPVSLGTLPALSPQGPGSLPSPSSGPGNLFNAEDVAWLQPALSALPARASPNQASLLLPQQHSQQLPQQHSQQYSQGNSYQTAQATNHPPPRNHQAWHGLPTWERPVGHPHLNQNLSEAAVARMVPTVAWAPLVSLALPCHSDQGCAMPCAGEASTEAEYQARREAVIHEVRYALEELVSPDPYEPFEVEELQQPAQPPAFLLPFVPIDREERVKLSQKMAEMGVTDPEHLSCAEPVDVVAHNPSPAELAPLDMLAPNDYEVPGGLSATQVEDFEMTHAAHDLNASLPHMNQQQQMYHQTYDQQWPHEQSDAFMMSADTTGLSHGNDAFRSTQHFGLPMQNHSNHFWH